MDLTLWIELIAFIVLLAMSGFFSSSETSLFSLNDLQIEQMRREKNPRLPLIERVLSQPRRLIVTILIGNELVNVAASVISAAAIIQLVGAENKWVNLFVMVPLLLLFGEITPKTLAIRHNVAFATVQAPLIELFAKAITPVRMVIRWIADLFITMVVGSERSANNLITEDMVRSLAREAVGQGALDKGEAHYINRIFDFGDTEVGELMTPRSQMFSLDATMSLAEVLNEIKRTRHTKIPVYDEDGETVLGLLFARDLLSLDIEGHAELSGKRPLGRLLRKAYFVPESKRAADLFHTFRSRKLSVALTVDEYGGVTGLVTMEDLLESIFGEIPSSSETVRETQADWEVLGEGRFRLSANMALTRFLEVSGIDLRSDDVETVGGLLLETFGEVPAEGATTTIGRCTFAIASVDGHRLGDILLEIQPEPEHPADQTDAGPGSPAGEAVASVEKEN